jgi:hypothetical protein
MFELAMAAAQCDLDPAVIGYAEDFADFRGIDG